METTKQKKCIVHMSGVWRRRWLSDDRRPTQWDEIAKMKMEMKMSAKRKMTRT